MAREIKKENKKVNKEPKKIEKVVETKKEEVKEVKKISKNNETIFTMIIDKLKQCKLKEYSVYLSLVSLIITIILLVIVIIDKPKLDLLHSYLGPQIKAIEEQKKLASKYNSLIAGFKKITAEEIVSKFNDDKITFVYYGRSGCQYCVKYAPVVKEVAKEKKVDFYYFNADELTQEAAEKLIALDKIFNEGLRGTPFTFAFKNGKLLGSIPGYVEKTELVKFIESVNK